MKCVAWFVFKNFRAVARYFLVPTCAFFTNCGIGLFFGWLSQLPNAQLRKGFLFLVTLNGVVNLQIGELWIFVRLD